MAGSSRWASPTSCSSAQLAVLGDSDVHCMPGIMQFQCGRLCFTSVLPSNLAASMDPVILWIRVRLGLLMKHYTLQLQQRSSASCVVESTERY